MIKLVEFGIGCTKERIKTPEKAWDEQFELLKGLKEAEGSYYDLSEEQVRKEQEKIMKKGSITSRLKLKIKEDEEPVPLGVWANNQKKMLNKYRGKTIEEIREDGTIDEEEKRRVIKLLEFGIQPANKKITSQNIGKATYTASALQCDDVSNVIKELLKEKEKTD